jgi:hypothetical protein
MTEIVSSLILGNLDIYLGWLNKNTKNFKTIV